MTSASWSTAGRPVVARFAIRIVWLPLPAKSVANSTSREPDPVPRSIVAFRAPSMYTRTSPWPGPRGPIHAIDRPVNRYVIDAPNVVDLRTPPPHADAAVRLDQVPLYVGTLEVSWLTLTRT